MQLDRDAFEAVVKTHQAELYRYARYLGAPLEVAEDVVQETFLAALRKVEPWANLALPQRGAWFRGIARNLFLQYCRKAKYGEKTMDPAQLENAEAVWKEEFLRAGDGFDYLEALRRCLEILSDRDRRVIALRYRNKASRKNMAASFGMSEDGIKSLLRRIRAALYECIGKRLALENTK